MKTMTVCPCGQSIPSNTPIVAYIKWLWAHRKHGRDGAS